MKVYPRAILVSAFVWITLIGPVEASPAGGVVGIGTPGSCTEAALDSALAGGGTVTFNCGGPATIQLTSAKTISQDTTIWGGNMITLTGGLTTRLFAVNTGANLSLNGIVLDRAFSNGADGGAISNAGALSLDDTRIQNSLTDVSHSGGAIYTLGPVSIDNSVLNNNSAGSGGAIYALSSGAQVVVNASVLNFNQSLDPANGIGGAIWLGAQAQLTATSASLTGNSALAGGALYLSPAARALLMSDGARPSALVANSAQYFGGAIFNEAGSVMLQDAYIAANQTPTETIAIGYGGAVDDEGWLFVNNTTFNGNQGRFGGAVFVGGNISNAVASIQGSLFYGNIAGSLGGGLYANANATVVTIVDSAFEYNVADAGGGLARTNAGLSISKSSFTHNQAQIGGGLEVAGAPNPDSAGYVEIHDSTISSNLAAGGHSGGLYNAALLDLVNVTIKDNQYGLFDTGLSTIARLQNIVLDNAGGQNCAGDGPTPSSAGYNYSTDTSCALAGQHDTQGPALNAMLGPLTTGPRTITYYHAPLPGSPLIDHAGPGCSPTDQLYALRPNACDIGAVEFGGLLPRIFVPLVLR